VVREEDYVEIKLMLPVTLRVPQTPSADAAIKSLLERLRRQGKVEAGVTDLEVTFQEPELAKAWRYFVASGAQLDGQVSGRELSAGLLTTQRPTGEWQYLEKSGSDVIMKGGCYRAFAAYVWRDCTDYEAKVNRTGLTRALNVLYANYDTDPPTIRVFDEDLAREHAINLTALDALVRSPDFTLEAWLAHDNVAARSYQVLLDFVSRVRTIITWLP